LEEHVRNFLHLDSSTPLMEAYQTLERLGKTMPVEQERGSFALNARTFEQQVDNLLRLLDTAQGGKIEEIRDGLRVVKQHGFQRMQAISDQFVLEVIDVNEEVIRVCYFCLKFTATKNGNFLLADLRLDAKIFVQNLVESQEPKSVFRQLGFDSPPCASLYANEP